MKKETTGLEIRPDERNYRIHGERNKALIRKSLEDNGAGRSIVVDNSGMTIGGAGVLEQARELGIPLKTVETDGSELVVVVRRDISPDDPRRKAMAVADNAATDLSEWDMPKLEMDFSPEELEVLGVDACGNAADGDCGYTKKIKIPQYEPKDQIPPNVVELCDRGKYEELLRIINQSKVKKEEKEFLTLAATRFLRFDYQETAEYYSRASNEMKEIMEKLALVIIDFNDAIANGFVKLEKRIQDCI